MSSLSSSSRAWSMTVAGALSPSTIAVGLIALGAVWFHLSGPLGPDVAWWITVIERMLDGQVLYADILEPNPPTVGYIFMPPVWVARILHLPPEPFVVVYTVMLAAVTTGYAARVAATSGLLKRPELLWPVAMLLVGVAWGENFAQREHIAAMLILPLLVTIARRAAGERLNTATWILAGLCGGLVLAIKPHFAFALLLPILYAVWLRRRWKLLFVPEMWLAGGVLALLVVLMVVVHPAFFTNILPVATAVYTADRRSILLLLTVPCAVGFAGMLLFAVLAMRQQWRSPLLAVLFCCAVGFGIGYLLQGRGYSYQIMPAIMLLAVCGILSFADRSGAQRRGVDGALALAAALPIALVPMIDDVQQWGRREPLRQAVAAYGPGLKIGSMLPDLTIGTPLHRLVHGTLVNSAPALLMTMSAYQLRREQHLSPERLAQVAGFENAERARLRDDFKRQPPDIIITSRDGFDWFWWADQDPELGEIVSSYEEAGTVMFTDYELTILKRPGLQAR